MNIGRILLRIIKSKFYFLQHDIYKQYHTYWNQLALPLSSRGDTRGNLLSKMRICNSRRNKNK